jgi:hypothetical protein
MMRQGEDSARHDLAVPQLRTAKELSSPPFLELMDVHMGQRMRQTANVIRSRC